AVADRAAEEVAAGLPDLHGHVQSDAAGAGVDRDLGAERLGHAQRDAARTGVHLEVLHVGEQAEPHGAAAGVDQDVARADLAQADGPGAGVDVEVIDLDAARLDAAGAGVHDEPRAAHVGRLDASRPGVQDHLALRAAQVDRAGAGVQAQPAAGVHRVDGRGRDVDQQLAVDVRDGCAADAEERRDALALRHQHAHVRVRLHAAAAAGDADLVAAVAPERHDLAA